MCSRLLQQAGVPAFVVADNKYLSEEDPHLKARDYFVYLEHPEVGVKQHAGIPWKMSRTECKVRGPAPLMGQHNDAVLTGLLGYSADEVAQMRSRGALD
jgi:crotonobetainyl-CoA:carnitine CoA-transferase CaiB-like acyl-CoA transferase